MVKKRHRRRLLFVSHIACLLYSTAAINVHPQLPRRALRVALHAQVSPKQGFVVGSVITTSGLKRALDARADVIHTTVFYPFEYEGLTTGGPWDLVLIEGWFAMINAFIHEVRAVSPSVIVLFWCLDPDYPGLHVLQALDVDGFLTNSRQAEAELRETAPTLHVALAADPDMLTCTPEAADKYEYLSEKVLFVGSAVGMTTKAVLPSFLHAVNSVSDDSLVLMGKGWDEFAEFAPYWKGVLPQDDLCCAYSKSLAALAVTMDGQRDAGMINNRVFEALLCLPDGRGVNGSRLISDHFPELEQAFGGHIRYAHSAEDVERHVRELTHTHATAAAAEGGNRGGGDDDDDGGGGGGGGVAHGPSSKEEEGHPSQPKDTEASVKHLIRTKHSYAARVDDILRFVRSDEFHQGAHRQGMLRVLVLRDPSAMLHGVYTATLGAAIDRLKQQRIYNITELSLNEAVLWGASDFEMYDAIWALDGWGGPVDMYTRQLPTPTHHTQRAITQRRALILWNDPSSLRRHTHAHAHTADTHNDTHAYTTNTDAHTHLPHTREDAQELRKYDVVYYMSEWDRECMQAAGVEQRSLQHAFGVAVDVDAAVSGGGGGGGGRGGGGDDDGSRGGITRCACSSNGGQSDGGAGDDNSADSGGGEGGCCRGLTHAQGGGTNKPTNEDGGGDVNGTTDDDAITADGSRCSGGDGGCSTGGDDESCRSCDDGCRITDGRNDSFSSSCGGGDVGGDDDGLLSPGQLYDVLIVAGEGDMDAVWSLPALTDPSVHVAVAIFTTTTTTTSTTPTHTIRDTDTCGGSASVCGDGRVCGGGWVWGDGGVRDGDSVCGTQTSSTPPPTTTTTTTTVFITPASLHQLLPLLSHTKSIHVVGDVVGVWAITALAVAAAKTSSIRTYTSHTTRRESGCTGTPVIISAEGGGGSGSAEQSRVQLPLPHEKSDCEQERGRDSRLHPRKKWGVSASGVSDRALSVLRMWPEHWDAQYYAQRLVGGMTRALCLGRGLSSVTITSPTNYTILTTRTIAIHTSLTAFDLGVDGSWCLSANHKPTLCIQRPFITLRLHVIPHDTQPLVLTLHAQLRSNVYANALYESPPVYVFVPPNSDVGPYVDPPLNPESTIVRHQLALS